MADGKKKQSKLVPFAIIGVASVAVVGGMIFVAGKQKQASAPQQPTELVGVPADNDSGSSEGNGTFGDIDSGDTQTEIASFEEESEQRLAELREQEAELEEIYQGTEETLYQGEPDDPALLDGEGGQFSNFDARSEPPAQEPAPEPEAENQATPDNVLTQSLMEQDMPADAAGVDDGRLAAIEDRLDALAREIQNVANTQQVSDVTSESAVEPIREDLSGLKSQVASISDRLEELGDQDLSDEPQVDDERLDALSERFEAFSEAMALQLEGLDERLKEVAEDAAKRAQAPEPKRTAAPSRPAVSGLYQLLAIEGNVAVLEGQNTGRTYRIAEGGDLAYGGRLLDIDGDQTVLAWPHRTVELSIYGQ